MVAPLRQSFHELQAADVAAGPHFAIQEDSKYFHRDACLRSVRELG